ncbi:MAG: PilN domain-containing protein [Pseudomonadota bacterium]
MTPDIDLIPAEYRETRWRQRFVQVVGGVTAVICLALLGVSASLAGKIGALDRANKAALGRIAITEQQQAQLDVMNERIAGLESKLAMLNGLRSGAPAEDLSALIDTALPAGEVWLDDLRLVRAGVTVSQGATSERAGYFIVIADAPADAPATVRTTLDLEGHAVDHAALSRFVRQLYTHPEVQDVRLDRTTRKRQEDSGAVGFELSITLSHRTEQPA